MPTRTLARAAVLAFLLLGTPPLAAQTPAPETTPAEQGFPIHDQRVRDACGICHEPDEAGRLSRISERRDTPEGWQRTIRRMAALHGLPVTPDEAREVVKVLSNELGLAPEEALPGRFEVERRPDDYTYAADRETEQTCGACHTVGRVINQRRTKAEWELLVAMHRGLYPLVDSQVFRRPLPVGTPDSLERPDAPDADDGMHTVDRVIEHLSEAFPLRTPEWAAWSATMRAPRLEGTWILSGYQAGQGPLFGQVTLTAVPDADGEFESEISYVHGRDGTSVTRGGRVIVYTGFQWRGRTTDATDENDTWREVLFLDRDGQGASGRWFQGAHDETGVDVTLRRDTGAPAIGGVHPASVRTFAGSQEVRIHGRNLADVTAADIDLGPGVSVTRVQNASPAGVTVTVDVAEDAPVGARDLVVGNVVHPAALTVYDRVGSIRVTPASGMARVGGVVFPKQYQQFEAWAYHEGPDGEPNTEDDLPLGPVDATWSLEEYSATFVDDDVDFVGSIGANGLFTPAADGVNLDRMDPNGSNARNNIGDVWVVATYTPDGAAASARPLRARAHLLVTVPLYMRWEPRPTAQ